MLLLEFLRQPALDDQTVIVKELLANRNVAQGFEKNAPAVLLGLQIGFTGMVDPPGRIAVLLGIDDMAVIQMKIKGMVGLAGIVRMKRHRFAPGDDFSFVFQHSVARLDGTDGVDALAVDARFAHLRAASAGCATGSGGTLDFILILCQVTKTPSRILILVRVYIKNVFVGQENLEIAPGRFNVVFLASYFKKLFQAISRPGKMFFFPDDGQMV
jgi:hypothetical protein